MPPCIRVLLSAALVLSATAVEGPPIALADVPQGMLHDAIRALAPVARQQALATLTRFPRLRAQAEHLQVSPGGGLSYVNCLPALAAPLGVRFAPLTPTEASGPVPIANPPAYSSLPGATNSIYLDFNGHIVTGTQWNTAYGVPSWDAMPYDLDGDPTTFSSTEKDAIYLIWQRVSEDLRVFSVNVTTVDPGTFDAHAGRALITRSTDRNGVSCPSATMGGVAYLGVFGQSYYPQYQPAWIYYDNISAGLESNVAEAVSHEMGHNLGLSHDGLTGPPAVVYFAGFTPAAPGLSWGTIMGSSYNRYISQWSQGEYDHANNLEDDVAILTTALSVRVDDYSDSIATASALPLGTGTPRPITSFTGIVNRNTDVDVFSFASGAGAVKITVVPLRVASGNGSISPATPGANLDAKAEILDSTGMVVSGLVADPQDNLVAKITGNLPVAGTYYLRVRGAGNRNPATDGYSTFGSIGSYTVTGTVPPLVTAGSISFVRATITEGEGSSGLRAIALTVARSPGATGAVSVRYDTGDLTATTADGDYTAVSNGFLTWAFGDPPKKTITIMVNGDAAVEPNESFQVMLSAPTYGAVLGATSTCRIVLNDDDLNPPSPKPIQSDTGGDGNSCGGGAVSGFLCLGFIGLLRRRRQL